MSSREREKEIKRETESELECSLCKDIFKEPKTLGCLHSFCLECLEIYVEKNHSNMNLSCPICRTPFQSKSQQQLSNLPTDSYLLNSLTTYNSLSNSISQKKKQKLMCLDGENEAISYCLDCQDYFCEFCSKAHQKAQGSKNHQLIQIEEIKDENQIKLIPKSNSQFYCQIHPQKEMELFCDDCKIPICLLCVPQHPSHRLLLITDVIEKAKQSLIDLINQAKLKETELRDGVTKCEEVIKELEVNLTTIQDQINKHFDKMKSKLNQKQQQELLNKLEEIKKYKIKELKDQKEELIIGIESIVESCQKIEQSLALSNQNMQLLTMKNLYESRLQYLLNNIWKIEPCHNSIIELLISKTEERAIYSNISNIRIIDSNEFFADQCSISRNDKQRIYENEEFSFEIISYSKGENQMRNGDGKRFKIHIEKESKSRNEKNKCEMIDLNGGRYEVKMKLKTEGKYSIFVKFNGININSSPFHIQVLKKPKQRNYNEINQPKLTFGSEGNENAQFIYPRGITVDPNGNFYICDWGNDNIKTLNSEGKFISTFGSHGKANGQFDGPKGITINSKGNIIVCDGGNHRIQIFDSEENFTSTFGSRGYGNGQFDGLHGICVDNDDNIYICDSINDRIQIFDSNGNFISTFGSKGKANGQFNFPVGITINSNGNMIVSDSVNNRIQIFDSKGNFISTFGTKGKGNGQFKNLLGICVNLDDNILVCDHDNNRIQIFDINGKYITQFKVNKPMDITIDPKTQEIIVCGNNHKISIF